MPVFSFNVTKKARFMLLQQNEFKNHLAMGVSLSTPGSVISTG